MAGYIGKSQGVTQVDGYNRTEADDRYVNASGDTMTGGLNITGSNFANTTYTGTSVNPTGVYTGLTSDGGFTINVRDSGYLQLSTNNTERVRVDSAGRVTMPYQPAFSAHCTTHAVTGNIVFNAVATNRGNHYNASNGVFTAPVTGAYFFAFHGMAANNTNHFRAMFWINGSPHPSGEHYGGVGFSNAVIYSHLSMDTVLQLNANDTVNVNVHTSYAPLHTEHNKFNGYLLG